MTMRWDIQAAIEGALPPSYYLTGTQGRRVVDAVLKVMREPNAEMMKRAATVKLLPGWQGTTATEAEGEHIWQAMIAAVQDGA